ncbi:MAG: hypothetical protein R3Y28_04115 [Candidatus Gastranaerophilales bacterium]
MQINANKQNNTNFTAIRLPKEVNRKQSKIIDVFDKAFDTYSTGVVEHLDDMMADIVIKTKNDKAVSFEVEQFWLTDKFTPKTAQGRELKISIGENSTSKNTEKHMESFLNKVKEYVANPDNKHNAKIEQRIADETNIKVAKIDAGEIDFNS